MTISVPERGTTLIGVADWTRLSREKDFWKLVNAGILSAESRKEGGWQLRGACYVGRAIIGGEVLEISEKFDGSFATLLSLGSAKTLTTTPTHAPVTPDKYSTPLLIALFIGAARRYLSGHKLIDYAGRPDRGTLVGGRLDVRGTARLHSKGMRHQAAFVRSVVTADVPFNRTIYAALRQIERISKTVPIARRDLASARALASILEECLSNVLRASCDALFAAAADASAQYGSDSPIGEAGTLAAAVLDSSGFGGADDWNRTIGRSWFVNLETQFETAVRSSLGKLLGNAYRVEKAVRRPPLFQPSSGRYAANPDVVIRNAANTVAIADAKYKDLSHWPSSADVHELLCHASAYHTTKAFLIFPSEAGFDARYLGRAAGGCEIWSFGIRFDRFEDDLRQTLLAVGLSAD